MTSTILTDCLKTLDHYKLFDRTEELYPFLLVDGHGSRFELEFLEYINAAENQWACCIGVPYGTSLWQVGDSEQQNGSFNMALTKEKQTILNSRDGQCIKAELTPTDMIPLIVAAWDKSFGRVQSNKKAIADRGWNPLNRNLLLHTDIRATMTAQEREIETTSKEIIPPRLFKKAINVEAPNHDAKFLHPPTKEVKVNLQSGTAAYCLDRLVCHNDLMLARERIKKERDTGASIREKLENAKKITAGALVKAGTHRLGKTIFDLQREATQAKIIEENKKKQKKIDTYNDYIKKANEIYSKKGKEPNATPRWTCADFKVVLNTLRRPDETKLPTKRDDLYATWNQWKDRVVAPPEHLFAEADADDDDDELGIGAAFDLEEVGASAEM